MIRPLLVVGLALAFHYWRFISLGSVALAAIVVLVTYRLVRRFLGRRWLPRTGKAVLITGCDSGFGELTALRLDSMGVRVFAGCLTQAGVDRLTKRSSSRIIAFVMDVTQDADVKKAHERVSSSLLPGEQLWALVNNAGILVQGHLEFLSLADYQRQMEVNYFGVLRVTKQFLPMLRRNRGRLVTIGSAAGLFSFPELSAYCSSKFALEAIMDSLRREMYPWGLKVVLIEPGLHRTTLMSGLPKSIRTMLDAQPEDVKKDYGSAYFDAVMRVTEGVDQVPHGKPSAVCDAILTALWSWRPEARYQVGADTILILPLSYLPAWVQDPAFRLLERLSGRDYPVPAAARPA